MSSQASFVSIGTVSHEAEATGDGYGMQIVGGRYEASPDSVADQEARGIQIDEYGKVVITGAAPDQAPIVGNPVVVGAKYSNALPTYTDGDAANLQVDANGYLRVRDQNIADLSKNAGAVDASTLRVQLTTENLANQFFVRGLAADNAAASGNPHRIGGQYNLALPTYDDGDQGTLQQDANGYLRVRDQNIADLDKNAGAVSASTLRVHPTSTALAATWNVTGTVTANGGIADNAADSGNPVKVGGKYNSTLPTYADGDRADLQVDSRGRVITSATIAALAVVTSAYVDFSSSNLPGNATNPLELVASLGADVSRIQVFDTGGAAFEIMTGAAAAEVRKAVFGPGTYGTFDLDIASGTRVSVRRVDDASALATGNFSINFLG